MLRTTEYVDWVTLIDLGENGEADRPDRNHSTNSTQWAACNDETCGVAFECLEQRLLMSGTEPLAPSQIVDMQWDGAVTQVIVDEWVVRFDGAEAKTDPLTTSLLEYGFDNAEMRSLGGNGFGIITATGTDYESIVAWADLQSDVLYVEPNFVHTMGDMIESTSPNDSSFRWLWGMNNTGQTGGTADADIDAVEAWDLTTGSSNVVIAVIDTGVDYTHPDLAANMWTNLGEIAGDGIDNDGNGYIDDLHGYDFAYGDGDPMDGHSHGTHTAGTIGAVGNNGSGVAGVNWDVSIMAVKFLSDRGSGTTAGAIQAVNYVTRMKRDYDVNVVATNNSWGGGGYSSALADAIAASGQQEILFIAAAGNDGANNDAGGHYPSNYAYDNVISVAATDHNDNLASFSNYGLTTVDLGAPGVSIYSTTRGGNYASYSGTSMATPHVAGVVGLLAAQNPQATTAEIKAAIMNGGDVISALSGRTVTGRRLNAYNALQLIGNGGDTTGPTVSSVSPSGQSGPTDTILVDFNEDLLAESVTGSNFLLRESGSDGIFDTADDSIITITTGSLSQDQADRVTIGLGTNLTPGSYRLTVLGTGGNPIQDAAGNRLNDGADTTALFEIINVSVSAEPDDVLSQAADSGVSTGDSAIFSGRIGNGAHTGKDVDVFAVDAGAGTVLLATIDAESSGSTLDSVLRLFDAAGNELTFNDDSAGRDSRIEYAIETAGRYYVAVSGYGNFSYNPLSAGSGAVGSMGDYLLTLSLTSAGDDTGPVVGPDQMGYIARSGIFAFEDIRSFGNVGLSYGDDKYFRIASSSLPDFDFDFYGRDQGDLYVTSNGLVTFGTTYTHWINSNLTISPTQAAIVPFWDDLVVDGGGSIVWAMRGSGDQQRLIVQWNAVRFYGSSSDTVTFQAVLYEADNSIRFNYADLDVGNHHSGGASASVGIRDTGTQAVGESLLQISINNGPNDFIGTGKSVVIFSNTAPVLDLQDQTMPHVQDTLDVALPGADADGDEVVYTVHVSTEGTATVLVSGDAGGKTLTVDPVDNYAGQFQVVISATDGVATVTDTFNVTVTNQAPVLSTADQTMPYGQGTLSIELPATDADGDTITYTASASGSDSEAQGLQERVGLQTYSPQYDNYRGWGEKYMQNASGMWFYILPNGEVYKWNGVESSGGNILEGTVDTSYYDDPQSLIDIDTSGAAVTVDGVVSVTGNVLTITPEDGFAGSFEVQVTATDGIATIEDTFNVTVTNQVAAVDIASQAGTTGGQSLAAGSHVTVRGDTTVGSGPRSVRTDIARTGNAETVKTDERTFDDRGGDLLETYDILADADVSTTIRTDGTGGYYDYDASGHQGANETLGVASVTTEVTDAESVEDTEVDQRTDGGLSDMLETYDILATAQVQLLLMP